MYTPEPTGGAEPLPVRIIDAPPNCPPFGDPSLGEVLPGERFFGEKRLSSSRRAVPAAPPLFPLGDEMIDAKVG